ncbi:MAG: glycosyl hydrolase, partial [Candidatus Aminicenantes bacterium]
MRNNILISFSLCFLCFNFLYSSEYKETTPALQSFEAHVQLKNESIFKHLKWRCVGPEFQGGRISSIAVHPRNPFIIYVSAGSGNLWKTINNGTTWEPVFDNQSTFAIGDIAISPSHPNVLWVGTGEDLMARSSYAGTGVFKSTDAGKTWQNMGLHDSHHIGRIVIHPQNPDIVYAAAMGHQYTFNEERGLFKTTDGGKTWEKVLDINEKVGVTEVVLDPADSNIILAAAWERDRKPWNNFESGPGSGIYKSSDAGKTWKKLTNGFPEGKYVGRIGLAIAASNPNVIYALLDNQEPKPSTKKQKKSKKEKGLKIIDLEKMSKADFLAIDKKKLEAFLRDNQVPKEYTAAVIREMVQKEELTPQKLAKYLLDSYADRKLHVTNVKGGEVYRSDDKGETWQKVSREYFDHFFSTYGYSFCDIRVSPDDEIQIYILGIRMLASKDGGKTFWHIGGKKNVHVDHHAMWVDPTNPDRLIIGNDGGLNFSYDRGETWQKINNIPLAEFYTISVDMAKPYNIYGGTQDNG